MCESKIFIMAHSSSETHLSIAERDFRECMRHADDFFKIELLRQAKNWYKKALAFNMETGMIQQRIAECDKMLKYERKVTGILAVVASIIVVLILVI